VASHLGSTS